MLLTHSPAGHVRDITIDIGEDTSIISSFELSAFADNFTAGNIRVNSETDASIIIDVSEDIETCDITSNGQTDSNIDLLADNNVTTRNLRANDDIFIAKNFVPEKANEVTTGNIDAGNDVEIVANDIDTQTITAGGTVTLIDDNSITTGDITAAENVILSSSETIETQSITAGRNITAGYMVDGIFERSQKISTNYINAGEDVKLVADEITTGIIDADGILDLDGTTIYQITEENKK